MTFESIYFTPACMNLLGTLAMFGVALGLTGMLERTCGRRRPAPVAEPLKAPFVPADPAARSLAASLIIPVAQFERHRRLRWQT